METTVAAYVPLVMGILTALLVLALWDSWDGLS